MIRAALPYSRGVAVVGLGSYARSELCLASDVDVLLLHDGWGHRDLEELVRAVCYPLWDSGLSLGHAVRTPGEAVRAAGDQLESATALTDRRLISGDAGLADDLRARYTRWMRRNGSKLLTDLEAADTERHAVEGERAGLLEPDLKRGAGGLRDIQSLRWAAACLLGEHGLEPLVGARYLGAADLPSLRSAGETLLEVRCALHLHYGRTTPGTAADRLTIDAQEVVAEQLGIRDADELLRTVNLANRRVAHLHGRAWPRMLADARRGRGRGRPKPKTLEEGVMLDDGLIEIEAGRRLADDPSLALRGLAAGAARGLHLGRETSTRLARELERVGTLRWTEAERSALLSILRHGPDALPALADADATGLLTALLPDWPQVRGVPQRNPFHVYDLDTHLAQTVAELGELRDGVRDPRHSTIWEGLDEPEVLLLGAWLHDVGKGFEGDHSVVGAVVAKEWLLRMGFDSRRADRVARLVRLHLLLPVVATSRDLDDADELDRVAEQVGDVECLDGLYLLTLADARATGPSMDSAWRTGLITELHARVRTRLSGDVEQTRALLDPAAIVEEARNRAGDLDLEVVLVGAPRRYLLAARPEQVVEHARLLAERPCPDEPWAAFRPGSAEGTRVLSVVAPDRLGLMADAAGTLAGHGLLVHEARAFTRGDGLTLDWFVVAGESEDADPEVLADVCEAVAGRLDVEQMVKSRESARGSSTTPSADSPIEVTFDRGPVIVRIEVLAPDTTGLLYRLGRVLAEERLDVAGARVATLGHSARDVFFVRPSGGPFDPEHLRERLRAAARWPAPDVRGSRP